MWEAELHQLARDHLLRELTVMDSPSGSIMSVKGQRTLLFASNDYLGLANHPRLKQAAQNAIEQFGVGTGASRLISGTLTPHQDLELALAQFTNTEASLTFSASYATNLGIIPHLAKTDGVIFADRLCMPVLLMLAGSAKKHFGFSTIMMGIIYARF